MRYSTNTAETKLSATLWHGLRSGFNKGILGQQDGGNPPAVFLKQEFFQRYDGHRIDCHNTYLTNFFIISGNSFEIII